MRVGVRVRVRVGLSVATHVDAHVACNAAVKAVCVRVYVYACSHGVCVWLCLLTKAYCVRGCGSESYSV